MFGLFAPSCPIETAEKAWVEWRMRWLATRLGIDRMLDATVVLPTDAFFPEKYQADEASARICLDRVCKHMRVDPMALTLTVLPDEAMPGAAGLYQQREKPQWPQRRSHSHIFIASSQLENPMSLIATLAHEVGHELLLGGGVLTEETPDHEQITDLLTVFLGVGVFNANATVHESSWREGNISGWSIGRQGYLSAAAFGYAFAVFAYVRRETKPTWTWAKHLRADARGSLEKGLRYLERTNDSLFRPDDTGEPRTLPTASQVLEGLTHRSATFRLGALWDIPWAGISGPELVAAVCRCLNDRDAAVQAEAARTLSQFGENAAVAVPQLLELVRAESHVWLNAITALVAIKADAKLVIPEIVSLINWKPAHAGSLALLAKSYGPAAEPVLPALLDALAYQLAEGVGEFQVVLAVIRDMTPDPESLLRKHFATDPEMVRLALWELRQVSQ